jgi:MoaA/NifB/PqqE/SkfB family radical SAM enzyme
MLGKRIRLSLTRKLNNCVPRPVVRLWYDPKAGTSRLRGPLWVLLQTVDRCNGVCTACPSKAATGGAPNLMDEGLYLHILDELRAAGNLRALVIMHQNEPLMDQSLPTRIRQAKQILGPGVSVLTVTNGSLLTPRRIDELLEAGVDEVHVSIDAVCETTFREVRSGLDYATVAENTRALLDRSKAGQVTVRFLKQRANEGEEKEFTQYWRARGAHVSLYEVANRAGTVREFERLSRNSGSLALKGRRRGLMRAFAPVCTTPFLRLSVLWDGRVGACCEDWLNRVIVGDLSSQSLSAVWHGEPMNRHRRLLWAGRYDEIASCRECSIRFGVGQH